ncbi:MAG: ribose 5-phosphate isomerase B [Desulfocapsaceae bacterium]|nr:ribose 5-phosphate isomerase B [Desulfocapsaceae bacterium]
MKIAIGSDHGGFRMKEMLKEFICGLGYEVDDCGCQNEESVDYPEYAKAVSEKVQSGSHAAGILICGSGIGMSMVANRYPAVRAALCHDEYTARLSREHNNANVLCLGARVTGDGVAQSIVEVWLQAEFAGGRHQRRIDQFGN